VNRRDEQGRRAANPEADGGRPAAPKKKNFQGDVAAESAARGLDYPDFFTLAKKPIFKEIESASIAIAALPAREPRDGLAG
jgi:hypothetical protein